MDAGEVGRPRDSYAMNMDEEAPDRLTLTRRARLVISQALAESEIVYHKAAILAKVYKENHIPMTDENVNFVRVENEIITALAARFNTVSTKYLEADKKPDKPALPIVTV
jgi:hypothetical protein